MKSKLQIVPATWLALAALPSYAVETKLEQATSFLREACVTSGSSFDVKATGQGQFQVSKLLGNGVSGQVTLSMSELKGFSNAASALSAQQASEMRNCMKPHIDKILNAILSQP